MFQHFFQHKGIQTFSYPCYLAYECHTSLSKELSDKDRQLSFKWWKWISQVFCFAKSSYGMQVALDLFINLHFLFAIYHYFPQFATTSLPWEL